MKTKLNTEALTRGGLGFLAGIIILVYALLNKADLIKKMVTISGNPFASQFNFALGLSIILIIFGLLVASLGFFHSEKVIEDKWDNL